MADTDPKPVISIDTRAVDVDIVEEYPVPRPGQSKRADGVQRNPPSDSTHTRSIEREDVPDAPSTIDIPTEDGTALVVEDADRGVRAWLRRRKRG